MHVKFGLHFDGLQPQRPTNAAGMVTLGPSGLLGVLETRLGLPPPMVHPSEAAFAYLQCLRAASAESRFFHRSLLVDPVNVARTLLGWRARWYEASWDGTFPDTAPVRLADMAAVEALARNNVPPSPGERLGRVAAALGERAAGIDCVELVRQANWQKVGGASPPKRRSNQATFLREPCVGPREGAGEASVAVRMGRAIEHRKRIDPGCRGFQIGRRQHCRHRFGEMSADPAVSENPCTFARLVSGPWEVFRLPHMS